MIELLRQALANGLLINQAGLLPVSRVAQDGCETSTGKVPFHGTMQIAYATEDFTDTCIERKWFGYVKGQIARELEAVLSDQGRHRRLCQTRGGIDVFMFQLEAVLSDQDIDYDHNLDLAEYQLQGCIHAPAGSSLKCLFRLSAQQAGCTSTTRSFPRAPPRSRCSLRSVVPPSGPLCHMYYEWYVECSRSREPPSGG